MRFGKLRSIFYSNIFYSKNSSINLKSLKIVNYDLINKLIKFLVK